MTSRLLVKNLRVRYPGAVADALAGVSLDVAPAERVAVIGESGSGKSTLALAIAGLLPRGASQSGVIDWPELGHLPLPGSDIGFVFQDAGASLDPVMCIGMQVAEAVRAHLPLSRSAAGARAVELLSRVGLPDPPSIARAYPHQLSGGQRQRAGIAAAIAAGPRLLIADEATSALDTVIQARIVELLLALCRADGMSLLFVTHDIALASGLADRIAVLRGGSLLEWGSAEQVITRPEHAYTRVLLAANLQLESAGHG